MQNSVLVLVGSNLKAQPPIAPNAEKSSAKNDLMPIGNIVLRNAIMKLELPASQNIVRDAERHFKYGQLALMMHDSARETVITKRFFKNPKITQAGKAEKNSKFVCAVASLFLLGVAKTYNIVLEGVHIKEESSPLAHNISTNLAPLVERL